MLSNKLFVVIAASLMSMSLCAQDVAFDAMDNNGDGKVTKDEFQGRTKNAGTCSQFDKNGAGYL